MGKNVFNKWSKTKVLNRSGYSRYVPETRRLSADSFRTMLGKHRMVYVKPVVGSLGIGVMQVQQTNGGVVWRQGLQVRKFGGTAAAYRHIVRKSRGKPYLVQRGIHLLRYGGRPFDIRLMVQRLPRGDWRPTGEAGRVAYPGKIVTNGSQGGTIYPVPALLRAHAGLARRRQLVGNMRRVALTAAGKLRRTYPGLWELGFDFALDRRLHPWILEVNTNPDPCPFAKLPDRRMLSTILRYGRANGRRYDLRCVKARRGR